MPPTVRQAGMGAVAADARPMMEPNRWSALLRSGSLMVVVAMQFAATATRITRGRLIVPVPFDPDEIWGAKPRHHVAGSVNGMRVRAVIEAFEGRLGFVLGEAWRRDCGIEPGDQVQVQIAPEGPQRADLSADVAAALDANPVAGQFFDSLAQFYRKGYLRWIDATQRGPQLRAERISVVVQLLADGQKVRPRSANRK